MRKSVRVHVLAVAALAAAAGCGGSGDGLDRQQVSGAVTFDGRPLESGSIQFVPLGEDQTSSAGGMIIKGRYDIPRGGGPTPGSYKVMIFTTSAGVEAEFPEEEITEETIPGEFTPVAPRDAGRVLPVRYNYESELVAEVEARSRNVFNYDLTK